MIYFIVQNALATREKVLLSPTTSYIHPADEEKRLTEAHSLCKQNETFFTYVFKAGLERRSAGRGLILEK